MPVHYPPFGRLALLLGLPAVGLVLLLVAPGGLDEKLGLLLRGICAQRPNHSFVADGRPLALEARMFGIFVGFFVAVVVAWLAGRSRRSEIPRGAASAALAGCIAVMGLDGLNAVLFDLQGPHLYPPDNRLRLATGLLSGLGLAAFIAPIVSFAFFRERDPRPLFTSFRELALSALPLAAIGGIVVAGASPGFLLSGLAALSVAGTYWLVNTYICVLAWDGPGQAISWGDLAPSGVVGFLLTAAGLVGLSFIRGWAETTFGVHWVV